MKRMEPEEEGISSEKYSPVFGIGLDWIGRAEIYIYVYIG
jgi:hypothetical protein